MDLLFSVCGRVFYDDELYFFIMNMIALRSHGCWQIIYMSTVWPPGPAGLQSLLCNARKVSCLILIITTSQPFVLSALKPVSAVYESIVPLAISLGECVWESGVLTEGFKVFLPGKGISKSSFNIKVNLWLCISLN